MSPAGSVTLVSCAQFWNTYTLVPAAAAEPLDEPMCLTPSGITMFFRPLFLNVYFPRNVSLEGSVIVSRDAQPSNI